MTNKEETYKVKATCKNCAWRGTQDIEKGCSVEVLSNRECPICGCEDLYSLGISKEMPLSNKQFE